MYHSFKLHLKIKLWKLYKNVNIMSLCLFVFLLIFLIILIQIHL